VPEPVLRFSECTMFAKVRDYSFLCTKLVSMTDILNLKLAQFHLKCNYSTR